MSIARCVALVVNAVGPPPSHEAVFAGVMAYAREIGSADVMSRAFKAAFGTSPGVYR